MVTITFIVISGTRNYNEIKATTDHIDTDQF